MRDAIFVFIDTVGTTKTGTHLTTHTRLASLDHHSHTSRHRHSHSTHNTQRHSHKRQHTTNQTLDSQPPTRCILYLCVAPAIALPRDASSGSYAPGGGTSTFSFLIFNRSDVEENDADRRSRLRERSDVGCVCSYPPGPGMPSASRFRGSCVLADVDAKEAEMRF